MGRFEIGFRIDVCMMKKISGRKFYYKQNDKHFL